MLRLTPTTALTLALPVAVLLARWVGCTSEFGSDFPVSSSDLTGDCFLVDEMHIKSVRDPFGFQPVNSLLECMMLTLENEKAGGFVFVGKPCNKPRRACCFQKGRVNVTRDVVPRVGASGGVKVQSRRLALQASKMQGHRSCIVPRVGMNTNYDVRRRRISPYIGGSDTVFHKGTESEIQCIMRCSKTAVCGGFTFVPDTGTCYLKTLPLMFIPDAGALSAQTLPRHNLILESTCRIFNDSRNNSCVWYDRRVLEEEVRCCQKQHNNVGFCYVDRDNGILPPLECPFDFEGDDVSLGGDFSQFRLQLGLAFLDGHCFVPYPGGILASYPAPDIPVPVIYGISEVECMVEVLNEKTSGGYQFYSAGRCPIPGLALPFSLGKDECPTFLLSGPDLRTCCVLLGSQQLSRFYLPPRSLRPSENNFNGSYINAGIQIKPFFNEVTHCYVPMPFVDTNWENGQRGVIGDRGSDIISLTIADQGSCMNKCSNITMCMVATFVYPDLCVLKAGPVFLYPNHDTQQPDQGTPVVSSMMKFPTSSHAPEASCTDDNVCNQLKSDGLFFDESRRTKFICCKRKHSNLGICKNAVDECVFPR